MKLTTPKSIQRRDRLVDSMAKKLADGGSVEKTIIIHRKRRIKTMKYVYIAIALSVISTSFTYLVMTGRLFPGLVNTYTSEAVLPEKSALDLLNDDLEMRKIGPDQYALYLRDFLIRYDSLPNVYKSPGSLITSDQIYRALFTIWPQVSLRTRASLVKEIPHLERKREIFTVEQQK